MGKKYSKKLVVNAGVSGNSQNFKDIKKKIFLKIFLNLLNLNLLKILVKYFLLYIPISQPCVTQ